MTAVLIATMVIGDASVPMARAVTFAVMGAVVLQAPILLVPMALGAGLILPLVWLRTKQRRQADNDADLAALCDLVAIGLTGGLGVHSALGLAAEQVGAEVRAEVGTVLRQSQVQGMVAAMAQADGVGSRLYAVVGRAAASGSPLLGPVSRLADELHADQAAARLQAVRRLPVALLFPLTLLILPGFLLLTVAPAILDAFTRLEI
ncbi:MAG: hypothetical protein GY926_14110 [bacterium]|nr:hypothetical protein [bacterium]MCP4966353.1 hypothetical protein [bacterium]